MVPQIVSLMSIVVLLAWMFYFLCGGLPLLILKHDASLDSRFVHRFFHVHYLGLIGIASIGALSSAFSNRLAIATAIGCIALIGFTARRLIVQRMDQLCSIITASNAPAIRSFRWLHVTGLVLNLFLVAGLFTVLIVWSAEIH